MMWRPRRSLVTRALLVAAVLGVAPGCTALDDYLPGTPFTLDQPAAEVTLVGVINVDTVGGGGLDCPPGTAVVWGSVRNTGDVDVIDVFIDISAFGPTGALVGTFRDHVFSGEIIAATDPGLSDSASTSLVVKQAGSFEICTALPASSVARTEYRTEFCYFPSGSDAGSQDLVCQ